MSSFDIDRLAVILRDAAKAEILPRFRRLDAGMVRQKTEAIDLVTEADEQAERRDQGAVAEAAWPEALFVGEESVAADPALLDELDGAEFAIIVDPVDGTANFAAGLPLFAVMAAVVRNGETIAGIIYDPMGDDWVVAEKGGGAWHAAARWHAVAAQGRDGAGARPDGRARVDRLPAAAEQADGAGQPRQGPGGGELSRAPGTSTGRSPAGISHFVMFNKLMPWDHLAGRADLAGGGRLCGALRRLALPAEPPRRRAADRHRSRQLEFAARRGVYAIVAVMNRRGEDAVGSA